MLAGSTHSPKQGKRETAKTAMAVGGKISQKEGSHRNRGNFKSYERRGTHTRESSTGEICSLEILNADG